MKSAANVVVLILMAVSAILVAQNPPASPPTPAASSETPAEAAKTPEPAIVQTRDFLCRLRGELLQTFQRPFPFGLQHTISYAESSASRGLAAPPTGAGAAAVTASSVAKIAVGAIRGVTITGHQNGNPRHS